MSDTDVVRGAATRVKICGITSPTDRDAAVAAGADALGFIVDVPVDTPREVDPGSAADLIAGVPPFVTAVLVTMPDSVAAARGLREQVGADAVQVHGGLDPTEATDLAETDTVVAAVDPGDPEEARAYDDAADALLVDSADAEGGGGTGRTHDWTTARELRETLGSPVILAGGLTPENVSEAVRTAAPYAVDVATGVERTGGEKDHEAVAAFVANATRSQEVASR
ncbi:MAG: phosphoribosylanthranilate isomerase [Halobacteriales archaeon]